ncbi:hypothetical protein B0J13DRAFT_649352 [Dactylonectria estremocensis]|uniref:Uncharacterized protein n=1 Tax=Dactylonectria estremocensis TaxID=1079267 RepID=A0A9P9IHU0_9HYPO|nr:hypothetical protein B0J13DRAFT_649352 [Dactylonectria estremocensis]
MTTPLLPSRQEWVITWLVVLITVPFLLRTQTDAPHFCSLLNVRSNSADLLSAHTNNHKVTTTASPQNSSLHNASSGAMCLNADGSCVLFDNPQPLYQQPFWNLSQTNLGMDPPKKKVYTMALAVEWLFASSLLTSSATRVDMARVVPVLHHMFDGSRARLVGRAVYARGFGACKLERVIWDQLVRGSLRFRLPPGVWDTVGTDDALVAARPTGDNKSAGQVLRRNRTCVVSSPNEADFVLRQTLLVSTIRLWFDLSPGLECGRARQSISLRGAGAQYRRHTCRSYKRRLYTLRLRRMSREEEQGLLLKQTRS